MTAPKFVVGKICRRRDARDVIAVVKTIVSDDTADLTILATDTPRYPRGAWRGNIQNWERGSQKEPIVIHIPWGS